MRSPASPLLQKSRWRPLPQAPRLTAWSIACLPAKPQNTKALRTYSPLVETYLQNMRPDKELGVVPYGDQYYLTRVSFKKTLEDISFHPEPGFLSHVLHGVKGQQIRALSPRASPG